MRRTASILSVLALLSLAPLGCGGDRDERGLAPANESATPDSPAADAETDAERQKKIVDEMQKEQIQEFDAENAGKPAQ
jgi:hypothetical protein